MAHWALAAAAAHPTSNWQSHIICSQNAVRARVELTVNVTLAQSVSYKKKLLPGLLTSNMAVQKIGARQ